VSIAIPLIALAQLAPIPVERAPRESAGQCESLNGEIVVCGSRKANDRYRLRPLPEAEQAPPKKAEITLGEGVTVAASMEEGGAAGAENVPRFMVKFKLKF